MNFDDMDKYKLIQDKKGYTCISCRQRFPSDINIVAEFECEACKRVSISRRNMETSSNFHATVSHVMERFKKLSNHHLHRKQESSDSDHKPISLNSNPSLLNIANQPSSAATRPRKRALLIGVTYTDKRKFRLKGTVNDVRNMRKFLIEDSHFHQDNVLVLTEEETAAELIPTKKNIMAALRWLVEDCRNGDSLVFYFSGHGLRQPDFDEDELDGFDEGICPVDFSQEGMILDNDINSLIVWPLPKGVTLHAIVDACHSGTMLDLVYLYNKQKKIWEDNSPPNGSRKHTDGGLAICISACEDNQMAADTTAFTSEGMNGALTYILIEILKKCPGPTYDALIDMIHDTIDKINKSGCLPVRIFRTIFHNKLLQKPLLSASEKFDVKSKHFML